MSSQQREEIVLALREHPLKRLTTITLESDNYTGLVKEVVEQVNGVVLKRVVWGGRTWTPCVRVFEEGG